MNNATGLEMQNSKINNENNKLPKAKVLYAQCRMWDYVIWDN